MRILFLADVFGSAGRLAVEERLPALRRELGAGFCILNGENAADGRGLTPKLADKLLAAGADVVTLGNHVWARDEIGSYLAESERVIRPGNVATGSPGRALTVAVADDGTPVSAGRNRTGIPVRIRRIARSASTPITESCGPVIPASVIAAVPPGCTRASLVCTWVCVPITAVTLPSSQRASATFSLVASA